MSLIKQVFWYNLPPGRIGIAVDADAVTEIILRPREVDLPQQETPLLRRAAEQLRAYFAGQRRSFDLPLRMQGTDFQLAVWRALLTIPYGETRSYAQIAAQIGRPKACRAVGLANGQNPLAIIVPCHRVIGADGSLTGYGGGLDMKRLLLDLEQAHR